MMKIEIELNELETLRKESEDRRKEIIALNKELERYDPKELDREVLNKAKDLYDRVMYKIFKEMGLDYNGGYCQADVDFLELNHWLGDNWIESAKLETVFGVRLSNKFQEAFIRMYQKKENDTN